MRTRLLITIACVAVALPASTLLAQNPTGTVTGQVSYEAQPLPGVTVTISSPAMQGTMTAITDANGAYTFKFLPAGDYRLTFALDSFRTLEQTVKVSVAQSKTIDAVMYPEAVTEEIVVTSNYETISSTSASSTTYEQKLVEDLPVARDIQSAALLAPGVAANAGSAGAVNIAGAPGPQSLFMVNGVVVNDTVWGNAFSLYIEDAIQETTTSVSGISAEYGRFTGGVVNMITKSGGNEFSGSYRLNLTNDDWSASTPLTTTKEDKINKVHEATLGGYVLKDRLWFFLAARNFKTSEQRQMYDETPYPYSRDQKRYEAKLTFSPHPSHRLLGSYMEVDDTQNGSARLTPVEPSAIIDRELPQEMYAFNYTGVLSENFFVEGQYAEREFTFKNSGGTADPGDRINGTVLYYYFYGFGGGSHLFCSSCPGGDESRNNENLLAKGSYFLSTEGLGTHDIAVGFDRYNDILISNNYQSPSNFVVYSFDAPPSSNIDGVHYPIIPSNPNPFFSDTWLGYWPILVTSRGTDMTTKSLYVNDTWRLGKMTFSLGARYDANDAQDGSGNTVSDASRVSPRLGATWDLTGNGSWLVHASYGRYVAALDANEGGAAGGGSPSGLFYGYAGPPINLDADGNYVPEYTTTEAMGIIFDWFDSVGGLANTDYWVDAPSLSGVNLTVPAIDSPYTDELSVGVTRRFGSKGLLRADYVYRDGADFYVDRTNLGTGTVTFDGEIVEGVNITQDFDLTVRGNDDGLLSRKYHGLHAQFQYRLSDRLALGGNWTWSHLYGNFNGENSSNGISVSGIESYPEYRQLEWAYPSGDLAQDQRHRVRAFVVWDALSSAHHNLTLSWLENFWTGTPYSASALVNVSAYVDNPGYLTPPSRNTYYFSGRGEFTTEDIHRTDVSLNYSFFANLFGADLELFVQPEVLNVFDEHGAVTVNTAVQTLEPFDPFTETPVEGVNWEKDPDFGKPDVEDDYQTPRTFRVSVGIRF